MARLAISGFSPRRAAALACSIALLTFGGVNLPPASAASGPFAGFPGQWAGTGIIRVKTNEGERTERIRCSAANNVRGQSNINLRITCKSDTYDFDLTGDFQADAGHHISGRWSELTRNVGGTGIGSAEGDRLDIHVESSALSGNLAMVTRGRSQAVSLDAQGAGQSVKASITMKKSSN